MIRPLTLCLVTVLVSFAFAEPEVRFINALADYPNIQVIIPKHTFENVQLGNITEYYTVPADYLSITVTDQSTLATIIDAQQIGVWQDNKYTIAIWKDLDGNYQLQSWEDHLVADTYATGTDQAIVRWINLAMNTKGTLYSQTDDNEPTGLFYQIGYLILTTYANFDADDTKFIIEWSSTQKLRDFRYSADFNGEFKKMHAYSIVTFLDESNKPFGVIHHDGESSGNFLKANVLAVFAAVFLLVSL